MTDFHMDTESGIDTGRRFDINSLDGVTLQRKQEEATEYLRNQGIISLLALLGLAICFNFPSPYVAGGVVVGISIIGVVMERNKSKPISMSLTDKAVLVTGCDSGFGFALAKHLADISVTVFAGCFHLTSEGATSLRNSNNSKLHVVKMDITEEEDVQNVLHLIKKEKCGLWGLVNNAGIKVSGEVELIPMDQFERLVNVNQLGTVRVTKTFLPLIRESKGRIINVTGFSGRLPAIYDSADAMTKFAIETFSDILRMEMTKFGVRVAVIEPGNFTAATSLLELKCIKKNIEDFWRRLSPNVQEAYGKDCVTRHINRIEDTLARGCSESSIVTKKIVEALFADDTKSRYLIGGSNRWCDKDKIRLVLHQWLPTSFTDTKETDIQPKYPTAGKKGDASVVTKTNNGHSQIDGQ